MAAGTAIRIDGVAHVYESLDGSEVPALAAISLDVADREFVAVVGPSGCGKSTLLRIIAGLIAPSQGAVTIGGAMVVEPRADVGIVFQAPTLLPWMSVTDNVLFPLSLSRGIDAAGRKAAQDLINLTGLAGFERRMPRELSGGMQQRVAICRALVANPGVMLMDEPFGALDALTREEMSLELLRICQEHPKTIYFVTHSVSEAVLLADRVVVMSSRPGRIADIVPIELPRPRSFDFVERPEFLRSAKRIRDHIFRQRKVAADA
ncbi:MAG: ABC transporter ATP-binding protein [Hyphomicrobiaceae bacterium]